MKGRLMEGTELIVTEKDKVEQLALSDLARAKDLKVTDNESYVRCCNVELQLREAIKKVTADMKPVKAATWAAHQAALGLEESGIKPRMEALAYVQEQRTGYERRQKAKAEEEQRIRLEEASRKSKQENEKVAKILEDSNEPELAEQVRSSVTMPTVPVEVDLPKIKGIGGTTKKWFYKIIDENKIQRVYLTPHEKKIQGLVNSQGKDAEKIVGGIEVWSEELPRGAAKIK
jgi:hypothetical protein